MTRMSLDYLKQIKELDEDKRKSIYMIIQGNSKFEKMLTMRKKSGDGSGLGYKSLSTSTDKKGQPSAFIKCKGTSQAPT